MKWLLFISLLVSSGVSAKDFKKETHELTLAYQNCVQQLRVSHYDRSRKQYFLNYPGTAGFAMLMNDGGKDSYVGIFSREADGLSGLKRVKVPQAQVAPYLFDFKMDSGVGVLDEAVAVQYSCQPAGMSRISGGGVKEKRIQRVGNSTEPLYFEDQNRNGSGYQAVRSFVVGFLKENPGAINAEIRAACAKLNDPQIASYLNSAGSTSGEQSHAGDKAH
jgi:hypothetical protein